MTLNCCLHVGDLQCASHNSTQYDEAAQQQENQCCEVSLPYVTRAPLNPISCWLWLGVSLNLHSLLLIIILYLGMLL